MGALSILELVIYMMAPYLMNHDKIGRKRSIYGALAIMTCFSILTILIGHSSNVVLFIAIAIVKSSNSFAFLVTTHLFRLFTSILLNYTKLC